ncbi:glycosyltransferase family 39 protein [Saccharibacillus sp. CPCC 101409]|uniref:glycosyltransferase family 39 protein n=1 Tax=Saccharibacillus sp. CPCC 101409 TaxID=3058041 RepID=UPI002671CFFD|nr:glycosyltransferase family 39 protein [Saccharibacillus sp. CPCC 101409]MDO3409414.1 glycosyltransferase family 39 protein [Saccharibacillus sp. CPCC 101409]
MKPPAKFRPDFWLLATALIALFLNGYNIWTETYANTYYTVAVASMMENFHNFFYASLDSAGSVTVDKPPVAFWIQTISALIFGLHGWSVILPQALAGVGSVFLIYLLVKPSFGVWAARIAAFAMACTPVAVAVSRTNNIDGLLVFTLLLASWLLFRAVRRGGIWSLLGAFAVIGIGFNMKMLQAYMILPAFYLFYLLAAKYGWKKKILSLVAATAVVAAVSVSWAVTVDSIPVSERPFIGSSGTNSVLNLAFGYNGVSRLTGDRSTGAAGGSGQGFGGGQNPGGRDGQAETGSQGANGSNAGNGASDSRNAAGVQGMPGGQDGGFGGQNMPTGGFPGGGNGGGGGMFNTGEAGPLRLFQSELSGQASWLIPLGLIGAAAILASWRRRNFTDKHKEIIFWLAWLVPVAGFFSIAGFFHQYYLIMLAPPVAALGAAAITELWDAYRNRSGFSSWLLPAAVLVTAGFAWFIIHPYDDTIGGFWSVAVLALGIVSAAALALFKRGASALRGAAMAAAIAAMFIGPVYWALTPIVYGQNSQLPAAGPDSDSMGFGGGGRGGANFAGGFPGGSENGFPGGGTPDGGASSSGEASGSGGFPGGGSSGSGRGGGFGGMNESESANQDLLAYLQAHNTGQEYLMAVTNYTTAAPYMIDEGQKLVILNGFNASDTVYTPATLEALVRSGKVKYFLLGGGGMGGGRGGSSDVTSWITENGTQIPSSEWQGTSSADSDSDADSQNGFGSASLTLYEVTLPAE